MPLTHVRTFRVRHYECDVYGHVSYANYLRYMQEAAFDASAAAGYDHAQYMTMGRTWLIRETDITYLHPLSYGDSVQVKTWVVDFRRIRSIRAYEFRKAGTDELAAQARTDWVFLDSTTLRPTSIPPEMMTAFFPEGAPAQAPPRKHFPEAPPPPSGVFKMRQRVAWRDIDPAQHVNNAVHLSYMVDCGLQAAAACGWPVARMREKGFGFFVRRCRVEYKHPAMLGDELEVATWASGVRPTSMVRHFTITQARNEGLLVRGHTQWVCVDLASGKPRRMPQELLEALAPNIADS